MSDFIQDALGREPDVTITSDQLVADGEMVDLEQAGVLVEFGCHHDEGCHDHPVRPVNRMTMALWQQLEEFVLPDSYGREAAAGMTALISFLAEDLYDTADEDEPKGELFASQQPYHALDHQPVWLQPNDIGGWTLMLPSDY